MPRGDSSSHVEFYAAFWQALPEPPPKNFNSVMDFRGNPC